MGVQPPNFSWVLPGRLAGLALPSSPAHYQFLLDQGIRHLVSLTERGPPHTDSCPGLTLHRLRIPDFCPPAPEQIERFVQIVDQANARGEDEETGGSLKAALLSSCLL
ncbi:dual specificity phosphatase 23 [Phyllostomus discolor]|uniref:Dual specificity phosphatase 23 n=1 Tax=Phyllostomus discolor TaxID=89673 RepID=A0A834DBZ0_9CHIR|nr:dual specificity phosphatase 23 [Phyllostomus discolor]